MREKKKKIFTIKQHIKLIFEGLKIITSLQKPVIILKTILSVFNAIFPFINIYFSAQILNEIVFEKNQNKLIIFVFTIIGLNLVGMLARSIIVRLVMYYDTKTNPLIYKIFSDKLMLMDYIDIDDPKIQHAFSEIRQNQSNMGSGLLKLLGTYEKILSGITQIVLSIAMTFSLFTLKVPFNSPYLYLNSPIAIVILLFFTFCSIILSPHLSLIGGKIWIKASNEDNKSNRIYNFYFFELMRGIERAKDIRIYDQKDLIEKYSDEIIPSSWQRYSKYEAKFNMLSTAVSYLSNGFIYLFVALKAFAGAFGVGGIVQYVGAITQFSGGVASIYSTIGAIVNNNIFLDKELKFLNIPNRKSEGIINVEKHNESGYEIEFQNVSFKYPSTDKYVLKNVSFKFRYGQRIAVVGVNGSGKTTMIKLLCRLHDPTEGIITLNGIDIKKYKYDEYLNIFSVVFQDFKLLPFTLAQNVATSVKYDKEKIIDALSKVGFNTRLYNMTKGIETYLYKNFEEDGIEISGGEAQKIALARALYKDTPFIILDEPTAALDPLAEYEIYLKLNEIVNKKTAIYISHRLSSCRFCDDIIVFHEGKLIQRGNHNTLITDEKGKYYELWSAQAQYYNYT